MIRKISANRILSFIAMLFISAFTFGQDANIKQLSSAEMESILSTNILNKINK